jgi:hypothetical protein
MVTGCENDEGIQRLLKKYWKWNMRQCEWSQSSRYSGIPPVIVLTIAAYTIYIASVLMHQKDFAKYDQSIVWE